MANSQNTPETAISPNDLRKKHGNGQLERKHWIGDCALTGVMVFNTKGHHVREWWWVKFDFLTAEQLRKIDQIHQGIKMEEVPPPRIAFTYKEAMERISKAERKEDGGLIRWMLDGTTIAKGYCESEFELSFHPMPGRLPTDFTGDDALNMMYLGVTESVL